MLHLKDVAGKREHSFISGGMDWFTQKPYQNYGEVPGINEKQLDVQMDALKGAPVGALSVVVSIPFGEPPIQCGLKLM